VLGVGLGDDFEYQAFGEPLEGRAARLDEALSVVETLLSGAPVDFEGEHFHVNSPPALPRPVNEKIPIWVGGHWPNPGPFRRAARYDGVIPRRRGQESGGYVTVDDLAAIRAAIGRDEGYDYVVSGSTASPTDVASLPAWRAAGATWWLESLHPFGGAAAEMCTRLRAGPPVL
jgi:alkanesulfonate monooxygenase SsuD/methylene tetrahydromethanopterin reductase-like flavin-dependent oxidoreductase (luciferase family)